MLVYPLIAEKGMAQKVLMRTLAMRVDQISFVADHPNALGELEAFHRLRKVMRQRPWFELDQPRGEFDLAGDAVLRAQRRRAELGQRLSRGCSGRE